MSRYILAVSPPHDRFHHLWTGAKTTVSFSAMSPKLAKIKEEIKSLGFAERFRLWRDLTNEIEPLMLAEESPSVESAWDAEIDTRSDEITTGKVSPIPGVEADLHTEALFASLGIKRPARA